MKGGSIFRTDAAALDFFAEYAAYAAYDAAYAAGSSFHSDDAAVATRTFYGKWFAGLVIFSGSAVDCFGDIFGQFGCRRVRRFVQGFGQFS